MVCVRRILFGQEVTWYERGTYLVLAGGIRNGESEGSRQEKACLVTLLGGERFRLCHFDYILRTTSSCRNNITNNSLSVLISEPTKELLQVRSVN